MLYNIHYSLYPKPIYTTNHNDILYTYYRYIRTIDKKKKLRFEYETNISISLRRSSRTLERPQPNNFDTFFMFLCSHMGL